VILDVYDDHDPENNLLLKVSRSITPGLIQIIPTGSCRNPSDRISTFESVQNRMDGKRKEERKNVKNDSP
jgi:hypothetical protein